MYTTIWFYNHILHMHCFLEAVLNISVKLNMKDDEFSPFCTSAECHLGASCFAVQAALAGSLQCRGSGRPTRDSPAGIDSVGGAWRAGHVAEIVQLSRPVPSRVAEQDAPSGGWFCRRPAPELLLTRSVGKVRWREAVGTSIFVPVLFKPTGKWIDLARQGYID